MVPDFWEFGQIPKWDIRASAVSDFENMTDLEHMPLPFLNFSHKHIILMLHLQQIVFLLVPLLYFILHGLPTPAPTPTWMEPVARGSSVLVGKC